jgi:hypothetical protein
MSELTLLQIINMQIEKIKNSNQTKEEMITELAILKTFLISQDLLHEMEEFRNLIYIELS